MKHLSKEEIFEALNSLAKERIEELRSEIAAAIFECEEKEDCGCDGVDVFMDEETGEEYYIEIDENLNEMKRIIRVTSKGDRIRKIKCPKGKVAKNVNGRTVCVTPTGAEKAGKKMAIRKAVRTKKAQGAGYTKRVSRKRLRALAKRKAMGIKNTN